MIKFFKKKIRNFVLASLAVTGGGLAVVLGGISTIKPHIAEIAVLLSSLNNPYFAAISKGINDEAAKLGLSVQYYDSNNNITTEQINVQNIIGIGQKVVLFNDVNEASGDNAVKQFTQAGVKVIALDHVLEEAELAKNAKYDINANNFQVVANIASDNVQAGEILALYLKDIIKMPIANARTFGLYGIPGTQSGMDRAAGFQKPLNKENGHYTLKVYNDAVASNTANNVGFQADDNRDKANQLTKGALNNFTVDANFFKNVIFGTNDEAALGAIAALKTSGQFANLLYGNHPWSATTDKSKVYVLGIDNTKDAVAAIKSGEMSATVKQNTHLMGQLSMFIAQIFIKDMNTHNLTTLTAVKQWEANTNNVWSYYKTNYNYWYNNQFDPSLKQKYFTENKTATDLVERSYYFKLFTTLTYYSLDKNHLVTASFNAQANDGYGGLNEAQLANDDGDPIA